MPRALELNPGDVFHELTVIGEAAWRRGNQRVFDVRCSCGAKSVARSADLVHGRTKACGPCSQKRRLRMAQEVRLSDAAISLVDAAVIEAITRGFRARDSIADAAGYTAEDVGDALARLMVERIRMRTVNGIRGWYLNEFSTTPKGVISMEQGENLSRLGPTTASNFSRDDGLANPFHPATYSIAGIAGRAQYHGPDSRRLAR